jgi:hypothetical protein
MASGKLTHYPYRRYFAQDGDRPVRAFMSLKAVREWVAEKPETRRIVKAKKTDRYGHKGDKYGAEVYEVWSGRR